MTSPAMPPSVAILVPVFVPSVPSVALKAIGATGPGDEDVVGAHWGIWPTSA